MDIFARVKKIADELAGSEAKLAAKIGITQQKLNRYLREESLKIWPLLPKILVEIPEVNRDWLFFGEGEMVSEVKLNLGTVACMPQTVVGRQVGLECAPCTHCQEMEKQIGLLRELLQAKDTIIAMHEKREEGVLPMPAPTGPSAHGTDNAAPSSRQETE